MPTIEGARELLRGRRRILVFTGAGISTESGIPDFRGPDGVWSRLDPADFTIDRYLSDPAVRRRTWVHRATAEFLAARPNQGHLAITQLWQSGLLIGCVTQNVDGLHTTAGLPAEAVAELHGSATTTSCVACRASVATREVMERVEAGDQDPSCRVCGGILKADVVLFGESLPAAAMEKAMDWAYSADAVLAVGTTLSVFPAAAIPIAVADRGQPFVIINQGPTDLDPIADLVVDGPAGESLSRLLILLGDHIK